MAIATIAGGLIWLADRYAPVARLEFPMQRGVAAALAIAGLAIAVAGVVSFRRVRTTVNPLNPAAASVLVVSGVYRFTRNPMYLGVLVCLLGWAVYLGSASGFVWPVVFFAWMNRLQIAPEETALRARFGSEFESYRTRVRRWI